MAEKVVTVTADVDPVAEKIAQISQKAAASLAAVSDAQMESAIWAQKHAKDVAFLESMLKRGLTTAERYALDLERVKKMQIEGAGAAKLQARAVAELTKKLEDSTRREIANNGRSLSMLFDELGGNIKKSFPGFDTLTQIAGKLEKQAADSGKELKGLDKAIVAVAGSGEAGFASIGAMVTVMGGFLIAGAAVAGITTKWAIETANARAELVQLAERTGISATELSSYQTMLEGSDVSTEQFAKGLSVLQKRLVEAQNPTSETAKLFKGLGIETTDTEGKIRPVGDVLKDISDRMAVSADDATRSAMAARFFGDELGASLVPVLKDGAAAIADMQAENDRLGRTMDDQAVADVKAYDDAVDDLASTWKAFKEDVGEDLIPLLTGIARAMTEVLNKAGGWKPKLDENNRSLVDHKKNVDGLRERLKALGSGYEKYGIIIAGSKEAQELATKQEKEREKAMREANAAARESLRTLEALDKEYRSQAVADLNFKLEELKGTLFDVEASARAAAESIGDIDLAGPDAFPAQGITAMDRFGAALKANKDELDDFVARAAIAQQAVGAIVEGAALMADRRIEAAQESARRIEEIEGKLQGELTAQERRRFEDELAMLQAEQTARENAARKAFQANQTLQVAQAIINTASAAIAAAAAAATLGPVAAAAAAGAMTALGGVQIAKILSTPPPEFHFGGEVVEGRAGSRPAGGAPNEVVATLETGEMVLTREQQRRMAMASQTGPTVVVYDRRIMSRGIYDDYQLGGRMRTLINRGRPVGRLSR